MITDVEVFHPRISIPPLPVPDGTGPYQIRDIEGVGPVQAQITSTKYGKIDGEFDQGATIGKRNIVLTVGLDPDWATQTMESLRGILYTYFMPKSKIRLRFSSTHMPTVEISGRVETCEPNIFSSDPEFQISVLCPSPNFVAVSPTTISGVTLALDTDDPTVIDYQGTVETGFVLVVTKDAGPDLDGEIRVINENPHPQIFLGDPIDVDATYNFQLSTILGEKYARKAPVIPGISDSILKAISPSSTWLQLEYGLNNFRVEAETPGQTWHLLYFDKYGGL